MRHHPLFTTAVCVSTLAITVPCIAAPNDRDEQRADKHDDDRVQSRQDQPPKADSEESLRNPDDLSKARLPFDGTVAKQDGDRKSRKNRSRSGKASRDLRTIDGSYNNIRNTSLGSTESIYQRSISGAYYADEIGEILDGVNTRQVSNAVSQQTALLGNNRGLSSMFWQWGQFIDHDMNLTEAGDEFDPIVITSVDPVFDIGAIIPFTRSDFVGGTNTSDPRNYTNGITHWLDGSMVYGSDDERATALRSLEGGRLEEGDDGFMVRNIAGLHNDDGGFLDNETQFLAGDIRVNEQSGLTAMHEVFFRYHNYWADRLADEHPGWDDERIYQTARKIVGAQIQSITYRDWLPALLGDRAMKRYRGYNPRIDASQTLLFSTAAFRIGHTMLTDELLRYNADGSTYEDGHLSLTEAFFNPDSIASEEAIAALLRGLAAQEANEVDTQAVESVRSFLFGDPSVGGLDLIALNLQRGRDHGIGNYNSVREDFGLAPVDSFDDITSDEDLAEALAEAYDSVDDIDPWIGLMAEDHLKGASVGETLSLILIDQFTRLRDGDRFWYTRDQSLKPYLDEIHSIALADVISLVTEAELQGDIFYANDLFVRQQEEAEQPRMAAGDLLLDRRRR